MTALTADRNTIEREGVLYYYPMAAAVKSYIGGLAVLDASGNCKPGVAATGLIAVGRFEEQVDNSSGLAAAKDVQVKAGIFHWNNSGTNTLTKANIGDTVYIEDDNTVGSLATGMSAAGVMVDIDSNGVYVETKPPVALVSGLAAANNLSDVGSAATSRTNLGLGTGDSPTFTGLTVSTTSTFTGVSTHTAGVQAGPGTASLIKTAKTSVTAAQLKALAASPITVVAAVASKAIVPLMFHCKFEYGSEILVQPSAPDDPVFRYVDGSGVVCSATFDADELLVKAADQYANIPAIQVEGGTLAELVNVPIVIHNTGGEYTGNASNDSVLEVTVAYIELDVS